MRSIVISTIFSMLQVVSHSASLSITSPTWNAAIYHISVDGNSSHKCSGTLINPSTILTAAQCVFENTQQIFPQKVFIHLGKQKLDVFGSKTQAFQVHEIISHPNYNSSNFENDIAVIRLSTEATPSDAVQPVCLWQSNRTPLSTVINKLGTVSGWEVAQTDSLSINLQQDLMPVVSFPTCLRSNLDFFATYLSDTNFCAGFRNGSSACNFDIYSIRGIVSTSATRHYKICSTEYVIFTDVAQYLTWINDVVTQLQCSDHSGLTTPTINPKVQSETTTLPTLIRTTTTDAPWRLTGLEYKGCYRDKVRRAYFKLRLPFGTNTVYRCAMKCYEHQFKYTGTEYGNECYCGNTLPNPENYPILEDSYCNRKCRGNRSEICGGRRALSVYTTGI